MKMLPIIDDLMLERDYNATTNTYVKQIMMVVNHSKAEFDKRGKPADTKFKIYQFNPIGSRVEFDLELRLKRKPLNQMFLADGGAYTESKDMTYIQLEIILDPKNEPDCYNKLVGVMKDILRHEIEHLTQAGMNKLPFRPRPTRNKTRDKISVRKGNAFKYYLLRDEIPAMVIGMQRLAKHEKKPLDTTFIEFLRDQQDDKHLTDKEIAIIMKTWMAYARKRLPNALYSKEASKYE